MPQRHRLRAEALEVLLHKPVSILKAVKQIALVFGEQVVGIIVDLIAQLAPAFSRGVNECGEHRSTAAHLEAVSFAGVIGRKHHHQGPRLVIEELGQPSPGEAAAQKTFVEIQRRRLAKPAHLRLAIRIALAKRSPGDLVHPSGNPGAHGRIRGFGVGVDIFRIQPKPQPVDRRFRRLPFAVILGLYVPVQRRELLAAQRMAINQNLSERALVAGAARLAFPLGVIAETDVIRLGQITVPFAVVRAAFTAERLGRFSVGEKRPLLSVRRRHGVVRLAIGDVCGVVNIVVPQVATDGLQPEAGVAFCDSLLKFLRQLSQLRLGLPRPLLQPGAFVVDQRLLVCAIKRG